MLLRAILFIVLSYSFCTRIPQYDFLFFSKHVKSTLLMEYLSPNVVHWSQVNFPHTPKHSNSEVDPPPPGADETPPSNQESVNQADNEAIDKSNDDD